MKVNGVFFNPDYIEKFDTAENFINSNLSATYSKDLLIKVWNIHNENINKHGEQLEAVEHIGSDNTDIRGEQPEIGTSKPAPIVVKPNGKRERNNPRVQPNQSKKERVQKS